jgi:hypothetical protein
MNDDLDRLLQDSLEEHAHSYEPRGDGLSRIRARVAARRARLRWLVPSLAMAAVAATVAGVLAVPLLLPGRDQAAPRPGHPNVTSPTPPPTPTPASTAQPQPALPSMTTLWPYQSRTQAAARERGDVTSGRRPYLTDAKQTALRFVSDYLGYSDPFEVVRTEPLGAGAGVILGARNPNNALYQITEVYLVRVASGQSAPYVVVRADAPRLKITDVSPGEPGAVSVSGYVGGTHEAVQARLLTTGGGTAASGNDGAAGALAPWRVVLGSRASPVPAGRYALVARTLSDANGQLSELVVRPYDKK